MSCRPPPPPSLWILTINLPPLGTYAVASLWSSLELFIGIIAANVALSRSIYRYVRWGSKQPGPQVHAQHNAGGVYLGTASAFRSCPSHASDSAAEIGLSQPPRGRDRSTSGSGEEGGGLGWEMMQRGRGGGGAGIR
jgi:hypothetical protein